MKRFLLPVAILALSEALHRLLFALGGVHHLLGSAEIDPVALALVAAFSLVRLLAFFVVPGWIAYEALTGLARRIARESCTTLGSATK